VFAGNARHRCSSQWKIRDKKGDCHKTVPFTVFVLELKSVYATLDSFAERFFTNSLSTSVALLLITLSPNMASFPTMLTSIL
jgi:hypothetical protein